MAKPWWDDNDEDSALKLIAQISIGIVVGVLLLAVLTTLGIGAYLWLK